MDRDRILKRGGVDHVITVHPRSKGQRSRSQGISSKILMMVTDGRFLVLTLLWLDWIPAHQTQKPTCQNAQLFTWHLPLCSKSWFHLWLTSYLLWPNYISLQSCYCNVYQLHCIRPYLDFSTACTIATSTIQCKLDYCNSVYYKLLSCTYPVSSRSRTLVLFVLLLKLLSPILRCLYWLRITERIEHKLLSFT